MKDYNTQLAEPFLFYLLPYSKPRLFAAVFDCLNSYLGFVVRSEYRLTAPLSPPVPCFIWSTIRPIGLRRRRGHSIWQHQADPGTDMDADQTISDRKSVEAASKSDDVVVVQRRPASVRIGEELLQWLEQRRRAAVSVYNYLERRNGTKSTASHSIQYQRMLDNISCD